MNELVSPYTLYLYHHFNGHIVQDHSEQIHSLFARFIDHHLQCRPGLPQCQDFSWQKVKLCGGGVSINSMYYAILS